MAIRFKGVDLDGDLGRVIPHLAAANECGGTLQQLQSVWDTLALLGQLSGTTADMSGTRVAFKELAENLLNQLGREALKKCLQELGAKAQVAINILVRNLFERTADIGFLATDEDVRAFLRERKVGRDPQIAPLRRRFDEYVRKYSVYSDIVLLDTDGNVLARLDETEEVAVCHDASVRDALNTTASYVETFQKSELFSDRRQSLIYSYRVTDDDGAVLGVICLCFRLQNEADLIFANMIGRDDWAIITLLDKAGTVISTSDRFHIPIGATLAPALDAQYRIVRFGPVEYVALTREAQPYQGYAGPGWYGHIMIPLVHAFDTSAEQTLANIDAAAIEKIIQTSDLFNDEIRNIPSKAERIQRELNRSVWNGNLKQGLSSQSTATAFSKTLLKEISSTGAKTQNVFQNSIADLNKTVVTSLLHDNEFHAALAIDIMDRNLYERANDCRWWALTAVFAELLSKPQLSDQDVSTIRSILRTINGLYTVYSNLIVFDRSGRVVAASDAGAAELEGTTLTQEWVSRILALRADQAYAVSAFEATPLYDDRPTYIYGAAILNPSRDNVVGGVAIVFDAAPQFSAMLVDALPREGDGSIKNGAFGVIAMPDGRVIACSDDQFQPGDRLSIDQSYLRLPAGAGHSGFTVVGDSYYAAGACGSAGYREYKGGSDVYHNDVVALIMTRLCGAEAQTVRAPVKARSIHPGRIQAGLTEDVATFFAGGKLLAARASEIIEAIDVPNIAPLPLMPVGMAGCLMYERKPLPVFDIARVLADSGRSTPGAHAPTHVVVMTSSHGERFGVLVDGLGEIAEVNEDRIRYLPAMVAQDHTFADAALASDVENEELVLVLRADQVYANLMGRPGAVAAA